MIDKEFLGIVMMTQYAFFYTLGGWKIKAFRREVAPAVAGIIFLISGHLWWKCLIYAIAQDITFRLPYGERTPYWLKALVGCTFVLPSMIFGFTAWQIILPVVFIVTFALSNWAPTRKELPWKICEAITGFLKGVINARLI